MKKGKLFEIDCKHYNYGVSDNYNMLVKRVSRWIRIDNIPVTNRHSLYDYADTYGLDEGEKPLLTCFRYSGRVYALGQFMRLAAPYSFIDTNGNRAFISGYDSSNYYNPLLIEVCESGERVRLYQELTELEYDKLFS